MAHLKKIQKDAKGKKIGAQDISDMAYPTLYVDNQQIPEIADWEVGKKYQLLIEVEQKSKSEMEVKSGGEERQIIDARFNIVAYAVIKTKNPENMNPQEFGKYKGEMLDKASKEK